MKYQNSRRSFLKYLGLGSLGVTSLPAFAKYKDQNLSETETGSKPWFKNLAFDRTKRTFLPKPIDIKVGIQPVSSSRIQKSAYEEPCR